MAELLHADRIRQELLTPSVHSKHDETYNEKHDPRQEGPTDGTMGTDYDEMAGHS